MRGGDEREDGHTQSRAREERLALREASHKAIGPGKTEHTHTK